MSKKISHIARSAGYAPGSLVYIGDKPIHDVHITVIEYNQQEVKKSVAQLMSDCYIHKDAPFVSWINIDGVHNIEIIRALGEQYNLHPLLLEDILNTELRPKIDLFEQHLFVLLKMLTFNEQTGEVEVEQVSLVLGENYVISLQEEREGDVFDPIRARLDNAGGKTRKAGADFLLYSLIDTIIDNYFIVLEKLGERLEDLEMEITESPDQESLKSLYRLKREIITMRKSVWPLREIVSSLERGETSLIRKETRKYIRDAYDHIIQVIDTTESYRDSMSSLLDVYLSSISNKTNDVMKMLTIISTIFMPLTFIAGVYGMNFDYMPELKWRYGYFTIMGVMLIILLIMIYFFRRKRWL